MKIGLVLPQWSDFASGEALSARDVVAFGSAAEDIGIDSVWLTDHLCHDVFTDFGEHGVELPPATEGVLVGFWECWTMLAALAAATNRVELGSLVTNTGLRNPALLARMAETVDSLSDGRLILGLGAGDFRTEHDIHGYQWHRRVGRFEEALQIIVPMLRGDAVTFEGEFYAARDARLLPRGPRPDGPPIVIGVLGEGPRMQRLAVQHADQWSAWLAFDDSYAEHYAERLQPMADACERHGRDPESLRRSVTVGVEIPELHGMIPGGESLSGSQDDVADEILKYRDLGVDHLSILLSPYNEEALDWLGGVIDKARVSA